MRKAAAFLCIVILLATAGCAGADLSQSAENTNPSEDIIENKMTFEGESESWTGKLTVDCAGIFHIEDGILCYDSDDHSGLTVTYKGDLTKLDDSASLRIECEGTSAEQTGHPDKAMFDMPIQGDRIAARNTDTVNVHVTLNGDEQTIALKVVENTTNTDGNSASHQIAEHFPSFWGQTDLWYCDFHVNSVTTYSMHDGKLSKDNKKDYELTVNCKGDMTELAEVKHLAIALDSPVAKGNLDETFSDKNPPQPFYTMKGSLDTALSPEDIDSVTVLITSDGETIKFKLSDNPTRADSDYVQNDYVFSGESESWMGELDMEYWRQFFERDGVLGCDSSEDTILTVTYKGDVSELSSVKHIKIAYETNSGSGSMEEEYSADEPIQQTTFTLWGSGTNGVQAQKDDIVTVTVTIDGVTESIELKSQG